MSDHDDHVSRRYRELAREEPPGAIDAAIHARAHRAVSRARAGWLRPVSIAAVLVMALGITLRMQQERPGIESVSRPAAPVEAPRIEPTPSQSQPQTQAAPSAQPHPEAPAAPPAQLQPQSQGAPAAKRSAMSPSEKRIAAPRAPAPQPPNPFAADIAPSAVPALPMQAAPPVPAEMRDSRAERSNLSAPTTHKRAAGAADAAIESEPEAQLQRIAAMREAGRVQEADEALARFRERWPDYRIPDALWQRVKPR
jgi:hypothetical protein